MPLKVVRDGGEHAQAHRLEGSPGLWRGGVAWIAERPRAIINRGLVREKPEGLARGKVDLIAHGNIPGPQSHLRRAGQDRGGGKIGQQSGRIRQPEIRP